MSIDADLHIHTHFSDSTSSPELVVQQANEAGLSCIAITDHDVIDGIEPTMQLAQEVGLEVITGIELSTFVDKKDVHILGYLFDHKQSPLVDKLDEIQDARINRMKDSLDRLKKLGIDNITLDEVCALTKTKAVGRPHLATKLLEKGWVQSMQEAFDKYLAEGKPGFSPKFRMSPQEAIELIHSSGGVAVMAHPMLTKKDNIIRQMVDDGLDGLEVYYPNNPPGIIRRYERLAKDYGLLMTGGSDDHGDVKDYTHIGKAGIPYEMVQQMKDRLSK